MADGPSVPLTFSAAGKDEPNVGLTATVDKLYLIYTTNNDGHKMYVQALMHGGRQVWECPGHIAVEAEVHELKVLDLARQIGCMDMLTAFRVGLAART